MNKTPDTSTSWLQRLFVKAPTPEALAEEAQAQRVAAELKARIAALDKAQATIEFGLDGTILAANENFLRLMGYSLAEIQGKHHSLFAEAGVSTSPEYRQFWDKLNRGEPDAGQYKRIGQGGREVWIQASYNPVFGPDGRPFKVVKLATDITDAVTKEFDVRGQVDAMSRAQAVIELGLDGTVLTANENFLRVLGYRLDEIVGKHHSMFVPTSWSTLTGRCAATLLISATFAGLR